MGAIMNILLLTFVHGTGHVGNFINERQGTGASEYFSKKPTGSMHLQMTPSYSLLQMISHMAKVLDWICIILILAGLGIIASSVLGNNGKWRKTGTTIIIGSYMWLVFAHTAIVAIPAMGQLSDMRGIIFVMTVLSEALFYVGTSTLYTVGAQNLELYEMAGTPADSRTTTSAFTMMIVLSVVGAVIYIVAGLI